MERLKDVLLPETVELHGLRAILANSLMPEHPFEAHYISSCSIYKVSIHYPNAQVFLL